VRLRFESHDDALNYADKLVEDGNRWLAVHELNVADRYVSGELEIRINFRARRTAEEYRFIFRPIPTGDAFSSLTFQSSLNIGALLFGVFGFLYSVFAMYSTYETRPPIAGVLRNLCRVIAVLLLVNFLLSAYSLYLLLPFGSPVHWPYTILASGLMIIGFATAAISLYMAFGKME
jgi:hypothetical protein